MCVWRPPVCARVCRVGVSAVNVLQVWSGDVAAEFVVDRTPPVVHLGVVGGAVVSRQGGAATFVSTSTFVLAATVSDDLTPDGLGLQLHLRSAALTVQTHSDVPLSAVGGRNRTAAAEFSRLSDGEYVLEAQAQDGAGNTGPFVALALVVDSMAPRVAPVQWPVFSRLAATEVCVAVTDAAAVDCTATLTVDLGGAPQLVVLALNGSGAGSVSGPAPGGYSELCGAVEWGGFQGNASVQVVALDPASNRGASPAWLVHDSVAPSHTAALVADPACAEEQGIASCRTAADLAVGVSCVSGGSPATASAPCSVEWAVVVADVLQQSACAAPTGASGSNVTVPSDGWTRAAPGVAVVPVGSAIAAAVLSAGGDRFAVKAVVFVRAVDDAGRLAWVSMCACVWAYVRGPHRPSLLCLHATFVYPYCVCARGCAGNVDAEASQVEVWTDPHVPDSVLVSDAPQGATADRTALFTLSVPGGALSAGKLRIGMF
jgi:hypothetical protein